MTRPSWADFATHRQRAILMIGAATWAVLAAFTDPPGGCTTAFAAIVAHGGRWPWVAMFVVDALALGWTLIAHYRVTWLRRLINACSAGAWATVIGVTVSASGGLGPESAGELALLCAAIWATMGTGTVGRATGGR